MLSRVRAALSGRYAVESERGRGATATVYAARDLKHGRRVALKVVEPAVVTALGAERFLQEIRTTAALNHPHILPLFDSGEADGFIYYTMPLVDGESLRERLDHQVRMPIAVVIPLVTQLADALAYAHDLGIVHRDLKPDNILIDEHERVWIADFGLARALSQAVDHRLTSTGIAVGSPLYMSPEQAAGDADVDGRSDIYSLGCLAFEALCGEPPFTAGRASTMLARHLTDPAPSARARCPDVPHEADAAIRRAMAKDRAHRFRDARDFAAAFDGSAGTVAKAVTVPFAAHASGPARSRLRSAFRRPPSFRRLALGVLAVVAGGVGILLLTSRGVEAVPANVIAMFPFRATTPGVSHWSEGVPDLLSGVLDGTAGLVVADPWTLWKNLRSHPQDMAASPDPERAAELARKSRAGRFVLGSIVDMGDSVSVSARVYDAHTGRMLHTLAAVGISTDLRGIVRALALQYLAHQATESGLPALGHLDADLTHSPDALKEFMRARLFMRRGMVDSAEAAITASLTYDSLFTPAIVDAVGIRSWAQFMRGETYSGLRELVDRALARDTLLRDRERLRLRAIDASLRTDGAAASHALHDIIAQDSTDLHAWAQLQYIITVYGWQYGSSELDALQISDHVLSLDSGYVPVLAARAWYAVATNDGSQYDRLIRLLSADSSSILAKAYLGCLRSVSADDSTFTALVNAAGNNRVRGGGMLRCLRTARPDRTEDLVRIWRASTDPWLAERGLAEEARLDIARGRTARVAARIEAGEFTEDLALYLRLMIGAVSLAGMADSEAAAVAAAELARYVPVDSATAYFDTHPVWWVGWMVGAYNAQYGDTVLSRQWQEAIAEMRAGGSPATYREALQADIEARLAVRRGDTELALQHARRAFEMWSIHTENQFESMPEPNMRLHLAMLLKSAGQADSARALLRSLVPPSAWMGFLTARSAFELGVLEEESGSVGTAERYYTMAWNLWSRGNPEIEPWRGQVEQALDRARRARL